MALIFQYGSNCLDAQINSDDRLCGDARFVCIAETVEECELAFDVWSKNRQCAAADIVTSTGKHVWGVVYDVPDFLIDRISAKAQGRTSLDAIEGAGRNYQRKAIAVRMQSGQVAYAITYRVREPRHGLKTSLEYVRYIVQGLRERGISSAYIDEVKRLAQANNPEIGSQLQEL